MNDLQKQRELAELIARLVAIGENREELAGWEGLFDALTEPERDRLLTNLKQELQKLEALQ